MRSSGPVWATHRTEADHGFVRAAAIARCYPLFVLIVGEDHHGTYRAEIERLIHAGDSPAAPTDRVSSDIDRLYHALDVFVFPSEAEGLGSCSSRRWPPRNRWSPPMRA
jgi:hypothetical protein